MSFFEDDNNNRKRKHENEDDLHHSERDETAFGYFQEKVSKKPLQGPHGASHAYTETSLQIIRDYKEIKEANFDYRKIMETRIVPSPGRANALLIEGFEHWGRSDGTNQEKQRREYMQKYICLYNMLEETEPLEQSKQLRLIQQLTELAPNQTYGWAKGDYTRAQIGGKGETRTSAVDDFITLKSLKEQNINIGQHFNEDYFRRTQTNSLTDQDLKLKNVDASIGTDYNDEFEYPQGFNTEAEKFNNRFNTVRRFFLKAAQFPKLLLEEDNLSNVSIDSDHDIIEKKVSTSIAASLKSIFRYKLK
ncbi:hypothetical protein [Undibacterium sp. RuTC16W]|uniref:hypothetical protein n=1 Tax=Undibacterium sp. RuTC16W TaxID=3413048 RepID=UPI003BF2F97F